MSFPFDPDAPVAPDGAALLTAVASAEGTPVYVYDGDQIQQRCESLAAAFGDYPCAVHYALKAHSTLAVLRLLRAAGARADANSGGEIEVARRAGFTPEEIVFTGVGKTGAELEHAVSLGLHAVNAESRGELERIDALSRAAGRRTRVALRVNPDVVAGAHPGISTGTRAHKFGVPLDEAGDVCRWAASQPGLALVGVHAHVGSQLLDLEPVAATARTVARFAAALQADGVALEHLDLGGGLGIAYDGEPTIAPRDYARTLIDAVRPTGLELVVEPGRWIVGPAGLLVTTVVDVKPKGPDGVFVVVDAGMSQLLRPALYGAWHRIEPLVPRETPPVRCDVVGPICETSDVLGRDRRLPRPEVGDRLVVRDTGAYGAAMANNYNRHPLPAEVLVVAGEWRLVRRRQTVDDMLALEA